MKEKLKSCWVLSVKGYDDSWVFTTKPLRGELMKFLKENCADNLFNYFNINEDDYKLEYPFNFKLELEFTLYEGTLHENFN